MGFVPQKCDRLLGYVLDRPEFVMVAVGTGEDDDAEFHCVPLSEI